ncbi:potassium-transporting ATPase subunit KdpA [Vagococcus fluvialis]|uniref:Potassium-transporting ATPase potassium-binding subunit n=2 Tax=Vagococcus fluvialis TaxID=2738 RepID=A0A7X6I2Y1_9ENTE|nr:potassium-transporting ATPase subunit KdpA [Vagococcus fluvialis]NKC67314.1 potassium-transporting ATPase subunit KdpA [Vagococcus fluvialis]
MSFTWIMLLFFSFLLLTSIPIGLYIKKVMSNEETKLDILFSKIENGIYSFFGKSVIKKEMSAKQYAKSVLGVSIISFLLLFFMLIFQGFLPGNPNQVPNMSIPLAFNTAASYVTNTNWQAYAGETQASYLVQMLGLTVQNFVSAAVGISVLFALLRGFKRKNTQTVGNFWQDMTRIILYVLLPISIIVTVLLMSQGVVQNLSSNLTIDTLESGTKQLLPMGPGASQIAIKQLGTNGGGFFGVNSAHPFENPTVFSNLVENYAILIIPSALILAFGFFMKDLKQGRTVMIVSVLILVLATVGIFISEMMPLFSDQLTTMGNMEGKETRFGIIFSSLWASSTTAVSNGSINAMLDSFTPLGGMIPMFLMQLGEIIFGGAGSGLYGMIIFIILTVFIAGLLVGRTPEYLRKKIDPYDMKMACLVILTPLMFVLIGSFLFILFGQPMEAINNSGPHGFSEILYAFTSLANNNGSAFAGLVSDTPLLNMLGGTIMLITRFVPMFAVIFLAGNLGNKKQTSISSGTLSTTNGTFIMMLIIVIFVIGALSFFPSLALGPIAEFFVTK